MRVKTKTLCVRLTPKEYRRIARLRRPPDETMSQAVRRLLTQVTQSSPSENPQK